MRFVLPLALLLLSPALPASAQALTPWTGSMIHGHPLRADPPLGFSQSVSGRFGLVMQRDPVSGTMRGEPLAELGLWLHWHHRTDNGWGVGITVGVAAGTPWAPRDTLLPVGR